MPDAERILIVGDNVTNRLKPLGITLDTSPVKSMTKSADRLLDVLKSEDKEWFKEDLVKALGVGVSAVKTLLSTNISIFCYAGVVQMCKEEGRYGRVGYVYIGDKERCKNLQKTHLRTPILNATERDRSLNLGVTLCNPTRDAFYEGCRASVKYLL